MSKQVEVTGFAEAKIMKALNKGVISESEAIGILKEAEQLDDPKFLAKVKKEIRAICPKLVEEDTAQNGSKP